MISSRSQSDTPPEKHPKTTEVGSLVKDWRKVYAIAGTASSTSSLGDSIEVPATPKVEKGAKKGKHVDKVFPRTSSRESADLSHAETYHHHVARC